MAFNYTGRNWDNLTYKSKGGDLKIKASAARQGATYQGALSAWGDPGTIGGRTVSGSVNPNVANPVGPQRTGALLPASVTGSGGGSKLVNVSPGNGLGAPMQSTYRAPKPKPARGYSLALAPDMGPEASTMFPGLGTDAQMRDALPNHLPPGYAERASAPRTAAPPADAYGPFLSELNPDERARIDRAGESYGRANGAGRLNSPHTYTTAAGGVVDPTLDQRPKFNPNTNPGYQRPAGSTATPGSYNNSVGINPAPAAAPKVAGYALPGESAYQGIKNPYGQEYLQGRLLASRMAAMQEYTQSREALRSDLAQRGLTQSGVSGPEIDMANQALMARNNQMDAGERNARSEAAGLGAAFDVQRAGALDSFGFNKGNLALGYSADARQGQLLPWQIEQARAGVASTQAGTAGQLLNNQFGEATMGDRIAGVGADLYGKNLDNQYSAEALAPKIAQIKADLDATGFRNNAAWFELDQAQQTAPMKRQAVALELVRLQQTIELAKQKGDIEMATALGQVAGRIAAGGGFKWIGGFIGAVGGPQGIAGGMSLGAWVDSALAPAQNGGK